MSARYQAFVFLLPVFIFCAPISVPAVDDSVVELIVKQDDNLITICNKYLENPDTWPEIARINKLNDANYILPGQRLIIPVRLLKSAPVNGRVVFIKGETTVQTAATAPLKPLQLNDMIRQGDLIRTGHESAVEIRYDQGTTFYLPPDSILELTTSQQKVTENILQQFLLSAGRMVMKIRRATGAEPRIEIQTPAAVFLARGTEFRVSIDRTDAANSEVLQGSVEAAAMSQTVIIQEGEGTRINKGEPPLKPRRLLPPPEFVNIQPVYDKLPLGLTVSPIENAVAYRVLLSKDEDGRNVVQEKIIRSAETLEIAGIENGTYYLQSRSIDELGLEGHSLAPQRIILQIKPQPPILQTPALDKEELHLRWSDQGTGMIYHYQISQNKNFLDPISDRNVNQPEITLPQPQGTGIYYVRVSTIAPAGQEGAFSPPQQFEITSRWPPASVIVMMGIIGVAILMTL
jgi:hypothetical protein